MSPRPPPPIRQIPPWSRQLTQCACDRSGSDTVDDDPRSHIIELVLFVKVDF